MVENQIRDGNEISKNNEFRNTLKLLYTRQSNDMLFYISNASILILFIIFTLIAINNLKSNV